MGTPCSGAHRPRTRLGQGSGDSWRLSCDWVCRPWRLDSGKRRRLLLEQDQLGEGARNMVPSSQVGAVEHLTRAGQSGQVGLAVAVQIPS